MVAPLPRQPRPLTNELLVNLVEAISEDAECDHALSKRVNPRWYFRMPVELHFHGRRGTEAKVNACVHDFSLTGAGVLCQVPIADGTDSVLVLPLDDGYYQARVGIAHCTATIGGFKIGCKFLLDDIRPDAVQAQPLDRETFERSVR